MLHVEDIPQSDTGTIEMDKEYGGPGEIRTPDPRHVKAYEESSNNNSGGAREFKSRSALDWQQFHSFLLQRMNANTAIDRMRYAKQYGHVLESADVQVLQGLSPDKRIHVMKALSNLAKFTGQYDNWLLIRQRYNLKWSTGKEKLDALVRFFDDGKTLDKMLQWLSETMQALPKSYSDVFLFCTLTGLRASECVNCIRLIKNPETFKTYYDPERQALCHYKFPNTFIRRTKAAYISLLDKQLLQIALDIDKTPHLQRAENSK
jgi:hypothetical protein